MDSHAVQSFMSTKICPHAASSSFTTPKSFTPESLVDSFKVIFEKKQVSTFQISLRTANALTVSQPASSSNWIHLASVRQASWLQTTVQCEKGSLFENGWSTCFLTGAFFVVGFRDRFGKPSGGVRVKTLRVDTDFLLRKKWPQMRLLLVFERFQGLNHWGVARLQGGVCSIDTGGLLWCPCQNKGGSDLSSPKTSSSSRCFRWRIVCDQAEQNKDAPNIEVFMWFSGRPKDDKQLGSEGQHLLKKFSSDVRRKAWVLYLPDDECTKSMCFLAMTWPWFNLVGKLLSWRCRFYQVVFPLTKLATICSWRAPRTAYCCGYQVGIKAFWPWNTSLLRTFQVEVWKKFWKVYPQKVSITRVCIKTSWTNNTVRWISGGETSWGKTLAVFFCRWARQLNDTIILPCAFFCELKKFLPTTSLTGYCWGIIENRFGLWMGKWSNNQST